jgi:hypothetical protein
LRSRGGGYLNVKLNRDGVVWYCHNCEERGGDKYEQRREASGLGPIKDTFDYTDENDSRLFQVLKFEPLNAPKEFRQRTDPDQKKWSIKGVRIVPFRLRELIEDIAAERVVFVVEGEKDVNTLRKHGVPATCNPMGAGKWWPEFNDILRGADVVICGDNDEPGRNHVRLVANNLHGVARRLRILDLKQFWPEIEESDDISDWFEAGGTVERLWEIVEQIPDWKPSAKDEAPQWEEPKGNGYDSFEEACRADEAKRQRGQPESDLGEWDAGDDPGPIPPRQWLLGNQFCAGFISSIVAAGGAGKTALRLLQFISLAIGRPLCGQHVFRRCRVLLISLEDNRAELDRRIKAILDYFNISRDELKGWLFCASPKLAKIAEMKNKTRVVGPLEHQIRAAIERRKPYLVSLDPFIKTHGLEENDSGDMDFVCDLLARIAVEFNVAVDSPHHVHKGQIVPGDADSGRGSSGIRDAGRLVYTLAPMSEDEATTFGINPDDRCSYVRLDGAKVNIAPRSGKATWFHIIGVPIGNATEEYPSGDTVQVVEPWSPPDTWAGLSSHLLNQILTAIDAGLPDGTRYTDAPNATTRAAWQVVAEYAPDKSEVQAREIVRTWVKNGVLEHREYDNPVTRKTVKGLHLNATKRPS